MRFFGKKSNKDAKDYVIPDDNANLPVAMAVANEDAPVTSTSVTPPSAAAASFPMTMSIQEKPTISQHVDEIPSVFLTRLPCQMDHCPCCQARCRTRVVTFPNWVTWTMCILIFFVFWPLCWVPLVLTKVSTVKRSLFCCFWFLVPLTFWILSKFEIHLNYITNTIYSHQTKQSDHYCTECNMKVGTIGACGDCFVQNRW